MSAETQLQTVLSGAAGVAALVADRIYPGALPEKTPYPAIVHARVRTNPIYSVSNAYFGADVGMQVGCWAKTQTQADAVGDAVEAALRANGFAHMSRQSGYDEDTGLSAAVIETEIFEQP